MSTESGRAVSGKNGYHWASVGATANEIFRFLQTVMYGYKLQRFRSFQNKQEMSSWQQYATRNSPEKYLVIGPSLVKINLRV